MSSRVTTAMILLFSIFLAFIPAALSRFTPQLNCRACEVITQELSQEIEKGRDDSSSILLSHRMSKDNSRRKGSYRTSELRAVELLDKLCTTMDAYTLRQDKDSHQRVFVKHIDVGGTDAVDYYDDKERENLKDAGAQLKWRCTEWLDSYHDEWVQAIKDELTLDVLGQRLCNDTSSLCLPQTLRSSLAREATARAAWVSKEEKRRRKETKGKKRKEKRRNDDEENTNEAEAEAGDL